MTSKKTIGILSKIRQTILLAFNAYVKMMTICWPATILFIGFIIYPVRINMYFLNLDQVANLLMPLYGWFLLATTRPSIDRKTAGYFWSLDDRIPLAYAAWLIFAQIPIINLLLPLFAPTLLFAFDEPKEQRGLSLYSHVIKRSFRLLTRTLYLPFYLLITTIIGLPIFAYALHLFLTLYASSGSYALTYPLSIAIDIYRVAFFLPLQLTFITNFYINAVYENFSLYYTLKKEGSPSR